MSGKDGGTEKPASPESGQAQVRDLIDFYRRWPEFRQTAVLLATRSDLSAADRETVHWLIQLADRVSEFDLGQ
jgi:hypothetical protein